MRKRIKVPIYFRTVIVDFDPTTYSEKLSGKEHSDRAGYVLPPTADSENHDIVVAFNEYGTNILVHESTHVAMLILKDARIYIDNDNDEPLAYLVGWIASEINKFYLKLKDKGKIK